MAIDLDFHDNMGTIGGHRQERIWNPLTRRALGTSGLFVHKRFLQSGSESTLKSDRKPSNFSAKSHPGSAGGTATRTSGMGWTRGRRI